MEGLGLGKLVGGRYSERCGGEKAQVQTEHNKELLKFTTTPCYPPGYCKVLSG